MIMGLAMQSSQHVAVSSDQNSPASSNASGSGFNEPRWTIEEDKAAPPWHAGGLDAK